MYEQFLLPETTLPQSTPSTDRNYPGFERFEKLENRYFANNFSPNDSNGPIDISSGPTINAESTNHAPFPPSTASPDQIIRIRLSHRPQSSLSIRNPHDPRTTLQFQPCCTRWKPSPNATRMDHYLRRPFHCEIFTSPMRRGSRNNCSSRPSRYSRRNPSSTPRQLSHHADDR